MIVKFLRFIGAVRASLWYWAASSKLGAAQSDLSASLPDNISLQDRSLLHTDQINLLQLILQEYPYWARGHLLYAEYCLEVDKISESYASAQAVLEVSNNSKLRSKAKWLLGKNYLKVLNFAKARNCLESLKAIFKSNPVFTEDLLAVYFGLELWQLAKDLLSDFPQDLMTQQLQVAQNYLNSKVS